MESNSYLLILESLQQPQGLFELYSSDEIRNQTGRIPFDSSWEEKGLHPGDGIALKYGIHQSTVRLQLITTRSSSYPLTHDSKGKVKVLTAPVMEGLLECYSYPHTMTSRIGQQILRGEMSGPLEHIILRQVLAADPQAERIRNKVGSYLLAVGDFAQELSTRRLSID